VLDEHACAALGDIADRALGAVRAAIASGRRVAFQPETSDYEAASVLYCWGEAALELLEHPVVHALGAEVLGDYLLNDLTVFSVPPSGGASREIHTTSWHRDCSLETNGLPGHVWFLFAIDRLTRENGATWVVPESHLADPALEAPLGEPWRALNRERFARRRQLELQRGDLAALDARVIHSSDRNDTCHPRRLINLGLVHAGHRGRVRANHWQIAGPRLARMSPRVRRMLGEAWPDRPPSGPPPVLPPGWGPQP
jgi:ectoine hydroxylase-related dioxygenase (phytanoyl-CoA dioxygenase family)